MQQLQLRIYFINYGHSHRLSRKTLIQNTSKIFYFCILLDLCTIIHNFKGLSILKFMFSAKWNWFCFVLAKMYTWMCHGLLVMSFTLKMICHKWVIVSEWWVDNQGAHAQTVRKLKICTIGRSSNFASFKKGKIIVDMTVWHNIRLLTRNKNEGPISYSLLCHATFLLFR